MRLAVLSDIHGNLPALEAVLRDLPPVDGMIVAGDYTAGPHVTETLDRLRARGAWMIRGNGENSLLQYAAGTGPAAWSTNLQFALLRWDFARLDAETLAFFESLPDQRVVALDGAAPIRVVHGSPRHPAEQIFPDRDPAVLDLALALTNEPVLVCGHTHTAWQARRGDRLALNPGAVCGPLDGTVGAQYALLDWRDGRWEVELRAVCYDLGQLRAAFRTCGVLAAGGALARAFLLSIATGRNIGEDFLEHARGLAAATGRPADAIVPDEIWEQAAATFDWQAASGFLSPEPSAGSSEVSAPSAEPGAQSPEPRASSPEH